MLAIVQIVGGLFGNFAADAFARIASIEGTLDLRIDRIDHIID